MKTDRVPEIESLLKKYNNLSECVIEEVLLKDYGTTVEILFNYIWDDNGELREDLNRVRGLTFRFRLVQELHFGNALNAHMCLHPDELNWGLNEIADARVTSGDDLRAYSSLPVPFHRVTLFWEGDRRVDIVFSEVEVLQGW